MKHFVLNYKKNLQRGRNTFFLGFGETLIFMSKFSMEAFLEINYELVFQWKEEHIFSCHVSKKPKVLKKIDFWYFKVQVSKWTWIENFKILGFFETNRSVGAKPEKGVQIILQILKPLGNTEILTAELVGDEIEMVA